MRRFILLTLAIVSVPLDDDALVRFIALAKEAGNASLKLGEETDGGKHFCLRS